MKGVVFTEFLDMVEDRFGDEMVDRLLEGCDLASGGAYTTVGTYDAGEMIALVSKLAQEQGAEVPDLFRDFGLHLFSRFAELFPSLFGSVENPIQFILSVEGFIHVEVRKLYPDAELPSFAYTLLDGGAVDLIYTSPRRLHAFAEGLLLGAFEHFGHGQILERVPLEDGYRFRISA